MREYRDPDTVQRWGTIHGVLLITLGFVIGIVVGDGENLFYPAAFGLLLLMSWYIGWKNGFEHAGAITMEIMARKLEQVSQGKGDDE